MIGRILNPEAQLKKIPRIRVIQMVDYNQKGKLSKKKYFFKILWILFYGKNALYLIAVYN